MPTHDDAAHLLQARKEGNQPVVHQLELVIRTAMDAKQRTLRPEIQLLNTLLAAQDRRTRQRVRCSVPVLGSRSEVKWRS